MTTLQLQRVSPGSTWTGRVLKGAEKVSIAEMKAQVARFRAPPANRMEAVFLKYYTICKEQNKKQIAVNEPDVNWKAVVMTLPPPQPSKVLGCGIRKVWLKEHECVFDGIFRFHVERLDGTFASFDWKDVYRDAYHSYFDKSFANDVEMALRTAILPHLHEYKSSQAQLRSHKSGELLTYDQAVVQHHPITFKELIASFLDHVQLHLEDFQLEYDEEHVYTLKDKDLETKWIKFHALRANYRVISIDEAMDAPREL
mmetsp:Transcript_21188/g.46521  ORF Transcript_21188/g.46521 Transcript_21188/m.46521 type:complete len:256 (+) Transcript_21188:56-823(+)|eukprot:CAMPEP_0204269830 /NCGR_PEP_ID=MMETSP0468-20130131/17358_1 /ASSEMBLY_ACC=CAM_ASM_000383 /TAXON_ID=2969 /ORGANISM="Oxyrrhis marina" /LENGTH=255 /DNA_ID=CAMNT_0051245277 /DNA_START=54 /DNA_END=821 /DNA_ORIENTATION=-